MFERFHQSSGRFPGYTLCRIRIPAEVYLAMGNHDGLHLRNMQVMTEVTRIIQDQVFEEVAEVRSNFIEMLEVTLNANLQLLNGGAHDFTYNHRQDERERELCYLTKERSTWNTFDGKR